MIWSSRSRFGNNCEETYTASLRGPSAVSSIFVDEEEMPGTIRPSGTYTVDGKQVLVRLVLTRDDKKVRIEVHGSADDPSGLATKIVAAILKGSENF